MSAIESLMDQVEQMPNVVSANYDVLVQTSTYTNDPVWQPSPGAKSDQNWNLVQIDAPEAWDVSTGKNVDVAVLDSGIDAGHPDLPRNLKVINANANSEIDHGTHTSGTVCARSNNGTGIVGVAPDCNLSMYSVYTQDKAMSGEDIVRNINTINSMPPFKVGAPVDPAKPTAPRVVNVSIVNETEFDCTSPIAQVVRKRDIKAMQSSRAAMSGLLGKRQDIMWVFSAGNESGHDSSCSAYGDLGNNDALPNVVTVAASDRNANIAGYSVRGSGVTVAAPGGEQATQGSGVYSTLPQFCIPAAAGQCISVAYGYMSGTSMAAPHVTGTAALAFGANPGLTPADVKGCLVSGATSSGNPIGGQNFSVVNAKNTVACAQGKLNQHAPLTNVQTVVAGQSGTYALKKDGTVWSWGKNYSGELGNGTTESSSTPAQIAGLSNVSAIAAGAGNAYALKKDGSVWAWGANDRGQLGNGTAVSSSTPVRVSGLPLISSIATRGGAAFAVGTDGSAWAWGNNWLGQAGIGSAESVSNPVRLAIPDAVDSIYPGGYTGYALTTRGTVWSWGDNGAGQLGNGTTTASSTPVQVSGLSGALRLFASNGSVVYALMPNHTLKVWGEGSEGALGNGTRGNSSVPIDVPNVSYVSQVAADPGHTFARLDTGMVLAWGNGWNGALGTGSTDNTATPTQVAGINTAISVASAGRSSWALLSDGTVRAWGMGVFGGMGNGTTTESNPMSVTVSGLAGVVSLAAGRDAAYAIKADGSVWSWGSNTSDQLGRPTDTYYSATPARF